MKLLISLSMLAGLAVPFIANAKLSTNDLSNDCLSRPWLCEKGVLKTAQVLPTQPRPQPPPPPPNSKDKGGWWIRKQIPGRLNLRSPEKDSTALGKIALTQQECEEGLPGDYIDCVGAIPGAADDLKNLKKLRLHMQKAGYTLKISQLTFKNVQDLIKNEVDFQRLKLSANEAKDTLVSLARLESSAEHAQRVAGRQQGDNEEQPIEEETPKQMSSVEATSSSR